MELSTEKRKTMLKDMKISIEEIEYMKRKTIDLEALPDDELMRIYQIVTKLWWEFIKLS